jgi:general L-amino acid transport system permease protein
MAGRPPRWSWSDPRVRAIAVQAIVIAAGAALVALLAVETADNLRRRGIASGFDYLGRAAGFEIARGPLPYSSRDTYARALGLALVNTLRVSALGIAIATALGVAIGLARLSRVWIVAALSRAYVEVVRNTPLLLQLLVWYSLSQMLPGPREALNPLPGVFVCERGVFVAAVRVVRLKPDATDAGTVALRGIALRVERPALAGFDFQGGLSITPEFAALLIGLSIYTAAFIAENVRGGILAIDRGQMEAALALGLSRARAVRLVLLPQALRAIVPPTTSQFLNLVKNSSLAVAIGYPDLISITNTTLNQTGQAIEAIAVAMTLYVGISFAISAGMNLYNHTVIARGGHR